MNRACSHYFFDETHMLSGFSGRSNILYCEVYFIVGGLVWKYREKMDQAMGRWPSVLALAVAVASCMAYFAVGGGTIVTLVFCTAVLLYAIGRKNRKGLLNNRLIRFISGISMEIYLCHMVVFRVFEKMGWVRLFKQELLSYVVTAAMTIAGSVIFAVCAKWALEKVICLQMRKRTSP